MSIGGPRPSGPPLVPALMPDSFDGFCSLWPGADPGGRIGMRGMHPLTSHLKKCF